MAVVTMSKKWSDELWNPEYRCKHCTAPYEGYHYYRDSGTREWFCPDCGKELGGTKVEKFEPFPFVTMMKGMNSDEN